MKHLLKVALRNIRREKLHSFINIFGLAVGLAATFLIFSYVSHELSYDRFHRNADHMYRFVETLSRPGGSASTYPININSVGPKVKEKFPQVTNYVRLKPRGETFIDFRQDRFSGLSLVYADSTFFSMFDFPLMAGNPQQALADPQGVVISSSLADKIFDQDEAMGRMIRVKQDTFRITGIMEDFPPTSHLQADILLPLHGMPYFNEMGSLEYATYLSLDPQGDGPEVRQRIEALSDRLISKRFGDSGYKVESRLQALTDIHLRSGHLQHDYGTNGDIQKVYMYLFLALVILVVAVINYLNLFTARAENRSKEVGLRKVVGASRAELIKQFLGESLLTTFFALVVALGLVELLMNDFGNMLGRNLSASYFSNPLHLLAVIGITGVVGLLAGYYPSFYLSRLNVITIFRGGEDTVKRKSLFTVTLVVVQFAIAIFLISAVIVFNRQVNYMKSKELGFDDQQVLVVRGLSEPLKNSFPAIRDQLLANPRIHTVTSSQSVPGIRSRSGQSVQPVGSPRSSAIAIKENRVNFDYVETMGVKLKKGRSFSREYGDEANKFIINETASRMLGLQDPVGKRLSFGFMEGTVIGLVEDYHFLSLKYQVDPLILTHYESPRNKAFYSMKIETGNIPETLDYVENALQQVDPNYTMNHFFVDQQFDRLYRSEERSTRLVGFATVLALIIAFLGLFALTSFSIVKRTREIGIRKAMGASQGSILQLFNLGMLKWIGVACLLASPLIWYFMDQWLQNFTYRIQMQPWMLLVSALSAAGVATLTTSTLTWRAANINPADTLKEE